MTERFDLNTNISTPNFFAGNNIQSLNGLRAIAVILVIISHIPYTLNAPLFFSIINEHLTLGTTGVQIFFAISGFLITSLLLKEKINTGNINIKRFYMRRLLRICPIYFLYIGTILLLRYIGIAKVNDKDIFASLFFVSDFFNVGKSWLVAHSWSLSVEQQFYLFWPLIFIFIPRKYIFILGIIILYNFLYPILRLYPTLFLFRGLLLSAQSIVFGAMLSIALYKNWLKRIHHILIHPLFGFSLILAITIFLPRLTPSARFLRIPFDYIFSSLLITAFIYYAIHCKPENVVYRILNHPMMVFIGLVSYSIYIWQQIFMAPAYPYSIYPKWTMFPLNIILVFIAAIASYYLIEKPFLRLKTQFK